MLLRKDTLITEISGKRPGDATKRPTEKFDYDFDKVIISNNSDGYETDWQVINVPEDYQKWYKQTAKMSDIAYYAPMNRSYAIKFAREHGYKYLIQLDDNINNFAIGYRIGDRKYTTLKSTPNVDQMQNDMFNYLIKVLEHTNAGIAGMSVAGASVPGKDFLSERYVYSAFALKLDVIPDYYQGDFEDDIEFRLKLKQLNIPSVLVSPFRYRKTSQNQNKDTTGNRQAYVEAGLDRSGHMRKLYGEYYSAGLSSRGSGTNRTGNVGFRHKLTPFKVGIRCSNFSYLKDEMKKLLEKYATPRSDVVKVSIIDPKVNQKIGGGDNVKSEEKSRGRPSTISDEALAVLKSAFKAGMTDAEACAMAEISKDALYRYQRSHADFATKKANWKKSLIGHAKLAIALDVINHKNVKTAQWVLDRESEHEKAAIQRMKAETERSMAEAEIARAKADILTGKNGDGDRTVIIDDI